MASTTPDSSSGACMSLPPGVLLATQKGGEDQYCHLLLILGSERENPL